MLDLVLFIVLGLLLSVWLIVNNINRLNRTPPPTTTNNRDANRQTKGEEEEPLDQPEAAGRKFQVPAGGVNIFGSAITSAIRSQQSSDSESSEDERSHRGSSRASPTSMGRGEPPPLPPTTKTPKQTNSSLVDGGLFDEPLPLPQTSATKTPGNIKQTSSSLGGGLFDDADDDDDLFSSTISKPASSKKTNVAPPKSTQPPPVKKQEEGKSLFDGRVASDSPASKKPEKSISGLFSDDDDDDDLFGIPKDSGLSKGPLNTNTSITENDECDGSTNSRQANLPLPSENIPKNSQPVKFPDHAKPSGPSLFSSPSDDDDLFSASKVSQGLTKSNSDFAREPPPFQLEPNPTMTTSKQTTLPSRSGKPQEPYSNTDEDHLCSIAPKADVAQTNQFNEKSAQSEIPEPSNSAVELTGSKTGHQYSIMYSPEDDIFKSSKSDSQSISSYRVDGDDDISADATPMTLSNSKSNANSQTKGKRKFDSLDDDNDIFAIYHAGNKSKELPASNISNKDVLSSKIETTRFVSERDNLASSKEDSNVPPVLDAHKDNIAPTETEKPTKTFKKPVGGVALFGGLELAERLSKSKSHISTKENTIVEQTKEASITKINTEPQERKPANINSIFDGESDDDILGSSQMETEIVSSSFLRKSPPPLPTAVEDKPSPLLCKLERHEETATETIKRNYLESNIGESEIKLPVIIQTPKPEEPVLTSGTRDRNYKETDVKPRKKLPIGGVSIFGGGGLGGKELLAKVKQRKSMLAPETDESEEDEAHISTIQTLPSSVEIPKPEEPVVSSGTRDRENVEEKTEVKPRKKPPIGGVSMFGGGGLGGKELLAKVKQRKSMLAPESDGSEEDEAPISTLSSEESSTPTTSKPPKPKQSSLQSLPNPHSSQDSTKPSSSQHYSSKPPSRPAPPVPNILIPHGNFPSPLSSPSPVSPVFLPGVMAKSGGQESAVSFDKPISTTTTLDSMNKIRVRGSQKRRPPTRAHRKSAIIDQDPDSSAAPTTTTTTTAATTVHSQPDHSLSSTVNAQSDTSITIPTIIVHTQPSNN